MTDAEREEIVGHAQELAALASAPTPEPGMLRQAFDQMRGALVTHAADATVQGLLSLMPGMF